MKRLPLTGLVALSLILSSTTYAQKSVGANMIYADLMGNGLVYSFSYERVPAPGEKDLVSLRAGFGSYPIKRGAVGVLTTMPLEVLTRGLHKNIETKR